MLAANETAAAASSIPAPHFAVSQGGSRCRRVWIVFGMEDLKRC
jgi:hypothetical protein